MGVQASGLLRLSLKEPFPQVFHPDPSTRPGAGMLMAEISKPETTPGQIGQTAAPPVEVFTYDEQIVRWFLLATVLWGFVGMLVGVLIALQLPFWQANLGEYLSYGRLRPLHTNAVIFAFGGCTLMATAFYVVQRTCAVRLWSNKLALVHLLGLEPSYRCCCYLIPYGLDTRQRIR